MRVCAIDGCIIESSTSMKLVSGTSPSYTKSERGSGESCTSGAYLRNASCGTYLVATNRINAAERALPQKSYCHRLVQPI